MPIFECPRCSGVENTATCRHGRWRLRGFVPLCSSCDPVLVAPTDRPRTLAADVDPSSLFEFPESLQRFDEAVYDAELAAAGEPPLVPLTR